ncbi:MAG: response regulator, partial [Thermodesulfobacteriota bacterium]
MNGFKVLVADDDESIALVLDEFFADKGVECLKALDGVEAARLIGDPGVRLALLDINMPGKHGLEILKDVKEGADSPAVIIMTAESTMENTLEAMKRGAFDYLTKPFDLEELDIVVERAIENVRLKEKLSTVTERLRERLESETVFVGRSRAV